MNMATYLRKHPFLLVTLFFMAGILSASRFQSSPFISFALGGLALLLAVASDHLRSLNVKSLIQSLLILLCFYLFGISRTHQQARQNQPGHFSHFLRQDSNDVIGQVSEVLKGRIVLEVEEINQRAVHGKLLIFSSSELRVGDIIFAQANVNEMEGPKNPFQFDFKRYNHYKQIWHQGNMTGAPLILDHRGNFNLWMYDLRIWCENILREKLATDNEYALACALILGDKREMGAELRNTYADTGAMHVLAVSGLHVGVVYMILLFFCKSLFPTRLVWRIFRSVFILGALWFFVYLVGAPISAWRAALMFSLFELGILASRSYYPVNILSLGALILLLIDTNCLFDVGFQLSFLAVLGIVTCQRDIQNFWNIEHAWGFRIWQMVSLSLAAQVFTFPLTIYYFHQFPIYFWLSGLFAVPLAFLVLSMGLLTLLLSWIPGVGVLMGYLLYGSTFLLNTCMFFIQKIPGIVVENLWMTQGQLITLLLLSFSFSIYLQRKRAIILQWCFVIFILFLGITTVNEWRQLNRILLIGYYDRIHQFADLVVGTTTYPLHDGELENSIPANVRRCRNALGIDRIISPDTAGMVFSKDGFVAVGEHRIFFSDSVIPDHVRFPKSHLMFVNSPSAIKGIDHVSGHTDIIIGCNRQFQRRDFITILDSIGLSYHDINKHGAIVKNLKLRDEKTF